MCAGRGLFLTRGFDAVTMDLIAQVAGVSKATLYANFKNKEHFFSLIMCEESRQISEGAWDSIDEEAELQDILLAIARNFFAVFMRERCFMMQRAIISAIPRLPELGRFIFENGPAKLLEKTSGFFSRAQESGRLNIDDPTLAAAQFFSLLRADIDVRGMLSLDLPSATEIDHVTAKAIDIFLSYYGQKAA